MLMTPKFVELSCQTQHSKGYKQYKSQNFQKQLKRLLQVKAPRFIFCPCSKRSWAFIQKNSATAVSTECKLTGTIDVHRLYPPVLK